MCQQHKSFENTVGEREIARNKQVLFQSKILSFGKELIKAL